MNKRILWSLLWHTIIFFVYALAAGYLFVFYYKDPNPIGVGVIWWICFLSHLLSIITWYLITRGSAKRINNPGKTALILVGYLIALAIVYIFLLDPIFANIEWKLKGK